MKRLLMLALAMIATAGIARAEIVSKDVPYTDGEKEFVGYVAYDDASTTRRPGILIVHQWTGLSDYEKRRARMLAEMGYVAFAADIYGAGIRPQPPESGQYAGKYKGDRALYRKHLALAFEQLKKQPNVDTEKLGAIGYCFGGTGVLELARSGADVDAVVSFHGGLDSPTPEDAANIKGTVLVLHGAADPAVPAEEVAAFHKEMESNKVDWQMSIYGHSVHGFTEDKKNAPPGKNPYNEKADKRSWQDMQALFEEKWKSK